MSEKLSSVAREEYLDRPNGCPFCGSKRIDAVDIALTSNDGTASQEIGCNECGAGWLDKYNLMTSRCFMHQGTVWKYLFQLLR